MKNIEVNKYNLEKFVNNLRLEDEKELQDCYGDDYKNEFIRQTLKLKQVCFLADKEDNPIAIGGVLEISGYDKKVGRVWLLSTKNAKKYKKYLYKYIKNKIKLFKKEYDFLFNYIYKSNFGALRWLKKCEFIEKNIDRENYKLFYFYKGGTNFDI